MLSIKLSKIISRFKASVFIKNIIIVMSGTAVAQAIGFALSPVISRLFSPSDFGIFGTFGAVTGTIASVATLEFATTIVLPKDKKDAINLFFISCLCTSAITLFCLLACLLAPTFILNFLHIPTAWILLLLVLAIFFTGLTASCQNWCVRAKAFNHTSASQVIRSLSSNGIQLGMGYCKGGALSLIFASVIADIIALINLCKVLIPELKASHHEIKCDRMKQLAKEYRDFPIYMAPMELMGALSNGLPVLLLTHYYGLVVAGSFAFGGRILSAPMQLVTRAFRQVFYQKASETEHRNGRLLPLYIKTTLGLFALAALPSLVLIIWAPQLFSWLFGARWYTAGEYARFLVLWLVMMFCNPPSGIISRILRLQRMMFLFDVSLLLARTIVLVLGGIFMSALSTIIMFAIVGAIMNLIYIIIIGHALMRKEGIITWKDIPNLFLSDSRSNYDSNSYRR